MILSLNLTSLLLTSVGTIVGGITVNPIILRASAAPGILIHGYLTKTNLNKKRNNYKFAFASYKKALNEIRTFML